MGFAERIHYGSFVSGIKTIGEQIGATSDFLTERAGTVFSCPDSQATTRKRGGTIPALQRLFAKVQRGELTPEEAIVRAEDLLGEDGASSPGFMHDLVESLHNCPRHHEQQLLELAEEPDSIDPVVGRTPQKPRLPRSTPDLGPLLHLRVEVWRDSKKKRKHTRVVKL